MGCCRPFPFLLSLSPFLFGSAKLKKNAGNETCQSLDITRASSGAAPRRDDPATRARRARTSYTARNKSEMRGRDRTLPLPAKKQKQKRAIRSCVKERREQPQASPWVVSGVKVDSACPCDWVISTHGTAVGSGRPWSGAKSLGALGRLGFIKYLKITREGELLEGVELCAC